jgi:UPF0755 protein
MRKLAIFATAMMVVALGIGGYFLWRDLELTRFANQPFGSNQPKVIEIQPGTGPKAVSEMLAQAGVVSSANNFYAFLRRERTAPRLKAGEYEFVGPLTPSKVTQKLVSGQVKLHHFTVPEGLRLEEILPILAQSDLKLDLAKLEKLSSDSAFARRAGVPANSLEGFLFPDTYSFTRGATEESVLAKMVSRLLEEYRKADSHRKPGVTLTLLQAVTLGSIIEKETGAPEERPRISCVFHNRLRLHMKLATDPTVLYAMRLIRGTYINNITSQDLRTEHPYNTYTTYGLPPGPIASPGAAALQAALAPIECNDLYFVSRNNGTHVFCPDVRCHEAAVEYWQREFFRQRNRGG